MYTLYISENPIISFYPNPKCYYKLYRVFQDISKNSPNRATTKQLSAWNIAGIAIESTSPEKLSWSILDLYLYLLDCIRNRHPKNTIYKHSLIESKIQISWETQLKHNF